MQLPTAALLRAQYAGKIREREVAEEVAAMRKAAKKDRKLEALWRRVVRGIFKQAKRGYVHSEYYGDRALPVAITTRLLGLGYGEEYVGFDYHPVFGSRRLTVIKWDRDYRSTP